MSSRVEIDDRWRQRPNSNRAGCDLVLVARRDEPSHSAATDLSNVVPFARPRAVEVEFPLASVATTDRPAPSRSNMGGVQRVALLVGSLVLHSLLLLMFWQDVRPLASIGVESMSVEITLGSTHAAGLSPQSGEQDVEPVTPTEERTPDTTAQATQETPQNTETPKQQAAEHTHTEAPIEEKTTEQQVAAVPTDSAGGVGRGRSDASSNYDGLVAAHLQRYKRYPAVARKAKSRGVATVSFTVDESGQVTSVELAQTSGVGAFDQEVVAMVRRASPFPRPPDRRSHDFTVPVRFN